MHVPTVYSTRQQFEVRDIKKIKFQLHFAIVLSRLKQSTNHSSEGGGGGNFITELVEK